jgi:superfamily II DNA/RNA helicase
MNTNQTPETAPVTDASLFNFNHPRLPEPLKRAIIKMGFTTPTEIQARSIPLAMEGRDLIGSAQTGTGKTAAFCIPTLVRLLEDAAQKGNKRALILTPTRELADQIETLLRSLTGYCREMNTALLLGGKPFYPQVQALKRNPRIIVATPGRLNDHLNQRTLNLKDVGILILDEADRMLDMGFYPQILEVISRLSAERQTLLFSATWDAKMDKLAQKILRNPERVKVGTPSVSAPTVKQEVQFLAPHDKQDTLLNHLNERSGSILIFTRTKRGTEKLAQFLDSFGLGVGRIHGDRTQAQRLSALRDFKNGRIRILVATDVASRGIDVPNIQCVINYDLPECPEDYIHRIGRAGRAGATGTSLSFVIPNDRKYWGQLLKQLKITQITTVAKPAASVTLPFESESAPLDYAEAPKKSFKAPRGFQDRGGRVPGNVGMKNQGFAPRRTPAPRSSAPQIIHR